MLTYRKQWSFFDTLRMVDESLSKDFHVITPKTSFRKFSIITIVLINLALLAISVMTYWLFQTILDLPSFIMSISYLFINIPYSSTVSVYCFSTATISRRFYYVNNIFMQLSPKHLPKNVFELCSRTASNERHTPTIALHEIYSIYGPQHFKNVQYFPSNQNVKSKEMMNKEIKNLTSKIEEREAGIFSLFSRKDKIEIEDFKLSKLQCTDDIIEHLTKLVDIHDELLDCVSLQNEILSIQILMIVAQIFVFGVFALFSLYRTLYNIKSTHSNILAFVNIFWVILYWCVITGIVSVSTNCVREGTYTGTAIHKVINKIAHIADPQIIEKVINYPYPII